MMVTKIESKLAHLLRAQKIAALGSLRDGAPLVTMVQYALNSEHGCLSLHASRLAWHTQGMLADPRVSLMICEQATGKRNPQTLARLSLMGSVSLVSSQDQVYETTRTAYLDKYPEAEINFGLGDFELFHFLPTQARFVAGFGQIFDLSGAELKGLINSVV